MRTISLTLAVLVAASAATPRAAARAYFEAIGRGDAEAALALVANPSDADRFVVQATAARQQGLRHLEEVAKSHFGERSDLGVEARQRRLLAGVERAPVEVSGDRAVVRPEGDRPLRLRRMRGGWRIESPAERLTGEERRSLEKALGEAERATKDLAQRIREGAVRSAEEAREALRKALGGREEEGVPL
jgi:hypothetical protein